jgi:glycine/D-amino acid oxidase-like deaminating enzyme
VSIASGQRDFDVIVAGAGAAGLMCAIRAGQRGRKVLLLDHLDKEQFVLWSLETGKSTAIYGRLASPEPVVAAGLRALDRGRPVVVPGLRNRVMATASRLSPGWVGALISGRMLRPAGDSRVHAASQ